MIFDYWLSTTTESKSRWPMAFDSSLFILNSSFCDEWWNSQMNERCIQNTSSQSCQSIMWLLDFIKLWFMYIDNAVWIEKNQSVQAG